jgi:hypothetical protein
MRKRIGEDVTPTYLSTISQDLSETRCSQQLHHIFSIDRFTSIVIVSYAFLDSVMMPGYVISIKSAAFSVHLMDCSHFRFISRNCVRISLQFNIAIFDAISALPLLK